MAGGPASIDVAATVGTWLAAVLATVALLGIIGPLLILPAARSERSQALRAVDDSGIGYVTDALRLTESIRFRRVRVPAFDEAPGGGGIHLRNEIRADSFPEQKPPLSSTGWVNLAYLASLYSKDFRIGDHLRIRQRETWFPIHRALILTVGLRGRYGHRVDQGEPKTATTKTRLRTEGVDINGDDAYRRSPTAEKLYGTTGTMSWRQTLDQKEIQLDEVYFVRRPDSLDMAYLDDPTPLDELFWLSIGCLPLNDQEKRVYFLEFTSELPYSTIDINRETPSSVSSPDRQPRFRMVRNPGPNVSMFARRQDLLPAHMQWTGAVGISRATAERVYCLSSHRRIGAPVILASEVEMIALAVMKLHPSKWGFPRLGRYHISTFLPNHLYSAHRTFRRERFRDVFTGIYGKKAGLLMDSVASLAENLYQTWDNDPSDDFSRERATFCYDVDSRIGSELRYQRSPVMQCIAVLTIVEEDFFRWVKKGLFTGGPTWGRIPVILRERSVEIGDESFQLSVSLMFPVDFRRVKELRFKVRREIVFLAALRAWARMVMIRNTIDSAPLQDMVDKMADICYVSPSTKAPVLHASS